MRWMLSPDWLPEWARWVFCLVQSEKILFTEAVLRLMVSHWGRLVYFEWMNEESWMIGQQTCPLTIHFFNMWTVSSDVSIQDIQRRHWQPLSVHLWAYCTHPAHYVNDVMCEGWPKHRGIRPLLFSNSGVGSFTTQKNQISVSAVRRDLRFSSLSEKTRKSNRLHMSLQKQDFFSVI